MTSRSCRWSCPTNPGPSCLNLLCLRALVSLPTPWHTTAKRQGWIPVLPNLLGGTQSEARAAGGQWGKMGREQGRPIPSPACWVRSLSFGPWVPHLSCSLARSCPVLVLSLLLRSQVGHFLLALQFTFTTPLLFSHFSQSRTHPFRQARFVFLTHSVLRALKRLVLFQPRSNTRGRSFLLRFLRQNLEN